MKSSIPSVPYELVDIRTFISVVESGSISKAARHLRIAKSVVSQRLARLEAALGTELLSRSNRGVKLTERGVSYLEKVSEGLLVLDAAAESMTEEVAQVGGALKLSAPTSFAHRFLSPLLLEFLSAYPELRIDLQLHDHRVDLAAEGYDLGVRITGDPPGGSEECHTVGLSRRAVCCSPSYLATNGVPRSIEDLTRHLGIGYTNLAEERVGAPLPTAGRLETNSGDIMRDAAIAGLGVTVLPLFIVAEDLRAGRLVRIFPNREPNPDRILISLAPRRSRLLRVRLLVEFIQQTLKDSPPWERDLPPALS